MSDALSQGSVVVSFAVPDESRDFRAGLAKRRVSRDGPHPLPTVRGEIGGRPVVVAHTGVGDSQGARMYLARLLAETMPPVRALISAGYAGALHPDLPVGELVLGENHSSPALKTLALASLRGETVHCGTLVTSPDAVETAVGKRALHASTGALAVDMETGWIAETCAAASVPMLSLRVVSDAADQDFPVPGRILYDAVSQRPRYLALPAWLALHPGRIAPFVRFVRGLAPARERLTRALQTSVTGVGDE